MNQIDRAVALMLEVYPKRPDEAQRYADLWREGFAQQSTGEVARKIRELEAKKRAKTRTVTGGKPLSYLFDK
jgi:hypothetical protein